MNSSIYHTHVVCQGGSDDVAEAAIGRAQERRREYLDQRIREQEERETGRTVPEWVMLWEWMMALGGDRNVDPD